MPNLPLPSPRVAIPALTAAVLASLAGGVTYLAPPAAAGKAVEKRQSELSISGCPIRLYPKGPAVHANVGHTCVGVKRVSITRAGRVQVIYAGAGLPVGVNANSDETLTARGIHAGVGTTSSYGTITLYDTRLGRKLNLATSSDYKRASGSSTNIWFSAVREAR